MWGFTVLKSGLRSSVLRCCVLTYVREDGRGVFLRNVVNDQQDYIASQPERPKSGNEQTVQYNRVTAMFLPRGLFHKLQFICWGIPSHAKIILILLLKRGDRKHQLIQDLKKKDTTMLKRIVTWTMFYSSWKQYDVTGSNSYRHDFRLLR